MQTRIDITSVTTDGNWPMMEQAGYVDFLISRTTKEFQDPVSVVLWVLEATLNSTFFHLKNGSPPWWNTGLELANALSGSIMIVNKGGYSKYLFELRELGIKILQHILSPDPDVGLPSLAPGIREEELESPSPAGTLHRIKIAGILVSALHQSLQCEPDPAFSRGVPYMIYP